MGKYRYQAVDQSGRLLKGRIFAESREQAISKIKTDLALIPTELVEEQLKIKGKSQLAGSKQNFLLNFTQQLANLLNSGVQVDDALTVLVKLTGNFEYRTMIIDIQQEIQGGANFSRALSRYPGYFNDSYVNMVKAGESGGVLGLCLERLADYIEQDREFKNSIKSAMMYPFVVLAMGLLAVVGLIIFVVPRFINIFDSLGQSLPLPTQILLGISNAITDYWLLIILGIVTIIFSYFYYQNSSVGRYQLDNFKNQLPFIGQIRIKLAVSRFTRILGTMLESGVPLLRGLEIAKNTLNNQVFVKIIDNLYEHVRKGGTLVGFLQNEELFPELAIFLIGVGEQTGNLEEMLGKVAETLAIDVKRTLKGFLTIFEPVIILLLGLFVLFVVMAILLPIFSLNQLPF